jgi:hypothetical protein
MNRWFTEPGTSAMFRVRRRKALPAQDSYQGVACLYAQFSEGSRGVAVVMGTVQ